MIFFVVVLIVFVLGVVICILSDMHELLYNMFSFLIIGVIIALTLSLLCEKSMPESVKIYEKKSTIELIALPNNSTTSDWFFVETDNINGNIYYYYVTQTEEGYSTDKIPANQSTIIPCDETPHIDVYSKVDCNSSKWNLVTIPFFFQEINCNKKYKIYIPEIL